MNVIEAINNRRSIRKFKTDPIPDELIRTILQSGINAPSGHNKQPWEFIVIKGSKKDEMLETMKQGVKEFKSQNGNVGSAEYSIKVMEKSPVVVFVFNPYGMPPWINKNTTEQIIEIIDIQSIGAAIQNMLLTALELGIGSLWICDIFYAYEDLCKCFNKQSQMVAAIAFGYTDEKPAMRPRKSIEEVTEWQ